MRSKHPQISRFRSNSGQVLLIMVLSLVVALTVGLSVASRAITNVKISKQSEESSRAFQAAEAGIDQALQAYGGSNVNISNSDLGNNAQFTSNLTVVDGSEFLVRGGNPVEQSIGADVQLVAAGSYSVSVYFGTSSQTDCSGAAGDKSAIRPAVEIIYLQNQASPTISKKVLDPCPGRTSGAANPDAGGTVTDGDIGLSTTFSYSTTLGPISNGYIMKVIPIYNSTKIGIKSGAALPAQGKLVKSTGTSGDTVRTVQYFESLPEIPTEILQYAILSQ